MLLKKIIKLIIGRSLYIKRDRKVKVEWIGTDYGGFYADISSLNDKSIIYSFGIGDDISFDRGMIERVHCKVYGFDPTPKSIQYINSIKKIDGFIFFDYGIGMIDGELNFFLPANPDHISASSIKNINLCDGFFMGRVKRLETIMKEMDHTKIDILKMDIEGAEYDVLDDILSRGCNISQILVEFHHRLVKNGKRLTMNCLKKIKAYGYDIIGVSDSFEEITFQRK